MIDLAITILSLIAISLLMNYFFMKTRRYKNECIDIKSYSEGLARNIKIVNLGSTYSKFAFSGAEELRLNAADLSIQAQCLEVDYSILKEYSSCFSNDCIVFICLAACCMLYEGNDNPLYCKILKKKNNPKYSIKAKFHSLFPLFICPQKIKGLIKHDLEYDNIYDSMPQVFEDNLADEVLKSMANGWISMFELPDLKSSDLSQKNLTVIQKNRAILKNIVDYCLERGFRPVIVVPPFSDKMNQYFSKDFTEVVIDKSIYDACGENSIPFLNYQWDGEFAHRYDLFKDQGFRLNEAGSIEFLRRLIRDLEVYHIQINNLTCGR